MTPPAGLLSSIGPRPCRCRCRSGLEIEESKNRPLGGYAVSRNYDEAHKSSISDSNATFTDVFTNKVRRFSEWQKVSTFSMDMY